MRHTIFCTFLCRGFARLQRESSRNSCMATLFMEKMSYMLLFTFFFHCRLFFPRSPLAFLIFSPPLQIHVVQSNKKWLPISRSSCLSLNFRFPFSFYWLFSWPCFTRRGSLNLELHLDCHTCWLSYFTLVCLWCAQADGRTVTWLPKFLGWVDYHIFLGMGLRSRRVSTPYAWNRPAS